MFPPACTVIMYMLIVFLFQYDGWPSGMEMPPTSMYGDPHARTALDTLTAAHHAAAAQHMNHSSRHEKLHFHSFLLKIYFISSVEVQNLM